MGKSSIEWTDETWNPVAGCTWASPGCDHCYAATMSRRLEAMGQADYAGLTTRKHFNGTVRTLAHKLDAPLRWRKPRMVFVNSMSDLFHKGVPFGFVDKVLAIMALTPQHTFQVLTKRPDRMEEYFADMPGRLMAVIDAMAKFVGRAGEFRGQGFTTHFNDTENLLPAVNVWLGASVENQATADERIPHLLRCPAAVRFLSCEPLLSPIDLASAIAKRRLGDPQPGWVIVGGESGHGARPLHPDWVRSIRDECRSATSGKDRAGVPFFFKQWGEWLPGSQYNREELTGALHEWDDEFACRVGKKAAGRLLDGREWSQFPVPRAIAADVGAAVAAKQVTGSSGLPAAEATRPDPN